MNLRWKIALALAAIALPPRRRSGSSATGRPASVSSTRSTARSPPPPPSSPAGRAATYRAATSSTCMPYACWMRRARPSPRRSRATYRSPTRPRRSSASRVRPSGPPPPSTTAATGCTPSVRRTAPCRSPARWMRSTPCWPTFVSARCCWCVAVSLAAAALGWLIAGTVTAPVRRLTRAAEDVGTSGRLDVEVPGEGRDEVGRLGAAFRQMLGALALSRAEQQRLVQDAGHELRTPLTSLKTNLSVMRRHPDMSAGDAGADSRRSRRRGRRTDRSGERTGRGGVGRTRRPTERAARPGRVGVRCRAARRPSPVAGHRRSRPAAPSMVDAPRAGLDRAISNLVDNACKFDQTAGPIEVVIEDVRRGRASRWSIVGPGYPRPISRRSSTDSTGPTRPARCRDPGSDCRSSARWCGGIGGTLHAANRDGGGAAIGFVAPGRPPHSVGRRRRLLSGPRLSRWQLPRVDEQCSARPAPTCRSDLPLRPRR